MEKLPELYRWIKKYIKITQLTDTFPDALHMINSELERMLTAQLDNTTA